jgi:hypothetical protein
MKRQIIGILGVVTARMLIGCAQPPPQQFVMQRPDDQTPQTVTFRTEQGSAALQASKLVRWRR